MICSPADVPQDGGEDTAPLVERVLVVAAVQEHSRKPDEVYERIAALVPGPYLELFARARREGWEAWGDEVGRFDQAGSPGHTRPASTAVARGGARGLSLYDSFDFAFRVGLSYPR